MSRKPFAISLALIVILAVVVAMNGDRLYAWLLAMHGGGPHGH